jgi:hypothetical protein
VVDRHRDASTLLARAGDVVLVERGRPRHLVLRCPCGCGDDISLNLDPTAGPCWRLIRRDPLTVVPSVWRETGCESHFFVWRHEVDWLEWDLEGGADIDEDLLERVEQSLDLDEFRSITELALQLNESLGAVRAACRWLVRRDRAREGPGRDSGAFCRR